MKNLTNTGDTEQAALELKAAGIPAVTVAPCGECEVDVVGKLHGWTFERRSCYWSAKADRGHALAHAQVRVFDGRWGGVVRAYGHGGGEQLDRYERNVDVFHVDTQAGLEAFAEFLKGLRTARDGTMTEREMYDAGQRLLDAARDFWEAKAEAGVSAAIGGPIKDRIVFEKDAG